MKRKLLWTVVVLVVSVAGMVLNSLSNREPQFLFRGFVPLSQPHHGRPITTHKSNAENIHAERIKAYSSGAEIDRKVEEFISSNQHIGVIYANGLTEPAKKALGLTEEQNRQIEDALKEAKTSVADEINSRMERFRVVEGEVVEYMMPAFPDRAAEIQNAFKDKITHVAGARLAGIAAEMMLVEPTYLGFGMNDLYFRITPQGDNPTEEGTWLIYHEERLPNTAEIVSHNEWNAADFIRLCRVFSFQ